MPTEMEKLANLLNGKTPDGAAIKLANGADKLPVLGEKLDFTKDGLWLSPFSNKGPANILASIAPKNVIIQTHDDPKTKEKEIHWDVRLVNADSIPEEKWKELSAALPAARQQDREQVAVVKAFVKQATDITIPSPNDPKKSVPLFVQKAGSAHTLELNHAFHSDDKAKEVLETMQGKPYWNNYNRPANIPMVEIQKGAISLDAGESHLLAPKERSVQLDTIKTLVEQDIRDKAIDQQKTAGLKTTFGDDKVTPLGKHGVKIKVDIENPDRVRAIAEDLAPSGQVLTIRANPADRSHTIEIPSVKDAGSQNDFGSSLYRAKNNLENAQKVQNEMLAARDKKIHGLFPNDTLVKQGKDYRLPNGLDENVAKSLISNINSRHAGLATAQKDGDKTIVVLHPAVLDKEQVAKSATPKDTLAIFNANEQQTKIDGQRAEQLAAFKTARETFTTHLADASAAFSKPAEPTLPVQPFAGDKPLLTLSNEEKRAVAQVDLAASQTGFKQASEAMAKLETERKELAVHGVVKLTPDEEKQWNAIASLQQQKGQEVAALTKTVNELTPRKLTPEEAVLVVTGTQPPVSGTAPASEAPLDGPTPLNRNALPPEDSPEDKNKSMMNWLIPAGAGILALLMGGMGEGGMGIGSILTALVVMAVASVATQYFTETGINKKAPGQGQSPAEGQGQNQAPPAVGQGQQQAASTPASQPEVKPPALAGAPAPQPQNGKPR